MDQHLTNSDALFYAKQYIERYSFLLPLGIVGIWRWSVWMMKEIIGINYHPKETPYDASVSIITPVYNENPEVFVKALESWKKNGPKEIIAVIDYTDETCINLFRKFAKQFKGAHLIITHVPGKRPALAEGIKRATSEIIALVDSDTIWAANVIKNGLPPFNDEKIAGVATYQSVLRPKTFAQRVFDIQLDLRYMHEYPFLAAAGNALVCLSGRTAFYRRGIITPMLPKLVHETFMGKPVISGDDKRLTYLVLAAGWKVAYQSNARVYTPGMKDLGSYMKQRLRWSRNSLRADLRAIKEGWPFHHPALLFFQIDKVLQAFVVLLSPIYFLVSLVYHQWSAAIILLIWWTVSRSIKIYAHLLQKPRDLFILPGYVIYSFSTGIIKIYALFTLNTQGWITRWDKSRLPQLRFLSGLTAHLATSMVVLVLIYSVYLYKQFTYFIPNSHREKILKQALATRPNHITLAQANVPQVLGASDIQTKQLSVTRYVTQPGDTIFTIAKKFGLDYIRILNANIPKISNLYDLKPGLILSIPGKDIVLEPIKKYNYNQPVPDPVLITYDRPSNTIIVSGRGTQVSLTDIHKQVGDQYIHEESPKVWHLYANVFIRTGATLLLDQNEVSWLKLESNPKSFVNIRAYSGDIDMNGVKVTSWDSQKNDYDKEIADSRSFIMVKDLGRMDIYNSELAYLGFATSSDLSVSPYGVSWKLTKSYLKKELLTGEVSNSKFHDNYFGAYTYGATGITWKGNEFFNNIRYGLDPHDDSDGFLVENNRAHDNGSHGIIFSKRCMYNTIRNNLSYNNKLHGIMLHELSDYNIIENNTLIGNTNGITLWHSSNNKIIDNKINGNDQGVHADERASNNVIQHNSISKSKEYGIYFYDDSNTNIVVNNTLSSNQTALYIKSHANQVTGNNLISNAVGIYFVDAASQNNIANNQIKNSTKYGIYTKINKELQNVLGYNTLSKNRKDVAGQ